MRTPLVFSREQLQPVDARQWSVSIPRQAVRRVRERLLHMLAEAAEMEHNLLCSYLYAAFSLRRKGEGLSEEEAAAVEGWRKAVVGVALEEMGHLASVNNLMVALGGAAHFDRPNFPVPPGYLPAGFEVRLAPLDEATLEHFNSWSAPAIQRSRTQKPIARRGDPRAPAARSRRPPRRETTRPLASFTNASGVICARSRPRAARAPS